MRYLPLLLLAVTLAGALLHGLLLIARDHLSVGALVAYLGLVQSLSYPAAISSWTFSRVQVGVAAARYILALMRDETELDENGCGHVAPIKGAIVFESVSFRYGEHGALASDHRNGNKAALRASQPLSLDLHSPMLALKNISFRAALGETIALVGQTGAGKSTLTKLVNRIYDATQGRILVDGVDVREWNLAALRSQIAMNGD